MKAFKPEWPAPKSIHALVTTRKGGVSLAPYDSCNMGDHVGDQSDAVAQNRSLFRSQLPGNPYWLNQTHSTIVREYEADCQNAPEADASYTTKRNQPCVVMTADCLPVLFCNKQGTQVAAAHAGWRGLLEGVLENTIRIFSPQDELMAYLGPAIGPNHFEVGSEVKQAFQAVQPESERAFSVSHNSDKWMADIYELARLRLNACGVKDIYGGDQCTFNDAERYFSYRRDGVTGRMASVIWIE